MPALVQSLGWDLVFFLIQLVRMHLTTPAHKALLAGLQICPAKHSNVLLQAPFPNVSSSMSITMDLSR